MNNNFCCDRCLKKKDTYRLLYKVGWVAEDSMGYWHVCPKCYMDYCEQIKNFITNIKEDSNDDESAH